MGYAPTHACHLETFEVVCKGGIDNLELAALLIPELLPPRGLLVKVLLPEGGLANCDRTLSGGRSGLWASGLRRCCAAATTTREPRK